MKYHCRCSNGVTRAAYDAGISRESADGTPPRCDVAPAVRVTPCRREPGERA